MTKIRTNNKVRKVLTYWELSYKDQVKVRDEYQGLLLNEDDFKEKHYFFFRGHPYLYEDATHGSHSCKWLKTINKKFVGWDYYIPETYYSGISIKIVSNNYQIVVGSVIQTQD